MLDHQEVVGVVVLARNRKRIAMRCTPKKLDNTLATCLCSLHSRVGMGKLESSSNRENGDAVRWCLLLMRCEDPLQSAGLIRASSSRLTRISPLPTRVP